MRYKCKLREMQFEIWNLKSYTFSESYILKRNEEKFTRIKKHYLKVYIINKMNDTIKNKWIKIIKRQQFVVICFIYFCFHSVFRLLRNNSDLVIISELVGISKLLRSFKIWNVEYYLFIWILFYALNKSSYRFHSKFFNQTTV